MAGTSEDLNLGKGMANGGQAAASGGKGLKTWLIAVGAVLVLSGGGAAAYLVLGGDKTAATAAAADPAAAAPAEVPEQDPIYLPLSPAFLVNFDDQGSTRYLQTELQIMSYEQKVLDKVEANMPAVRNGLIMLLSDQDYAGLNTVQGKEDLRKQILDRINEVIRAKETARVNDVFLTSFVIQ